MDNKINEIRRKISALRAEMIDAEAAMRDRLGSGQDSSESANSLLGLRKDMTRLIGEWRAAGGGDLLPNLAQRISTGFPNKGASRAGAPPRR